MKALLIIDVQNDYFPGGKCELEGAEEALTNVNNTLQAYRKKGLPVIHVQHVNLRSGATFFLPDTRGVQIHEELAPIDGESVIIKHFPNSFHETGLLDLLTSKSISELVVCGMMTHMCIDTTVRAAKDFGIPITLLYDACATKDLQIMKETISAHSVHVSYMAGLNGMFAQVILTEQLEI